MSTSLEKIIAEQGKHAVGYFSCIVNPRQIDGGAKCKVDIDNFELVDIYFEDGDDETPYIKPLANNDTKGYIVYSSEVLHDEALETKLDFYNGKNTMANVYVQEVGTTFKTNNFETALEAVKAGMYAQWTVGAGAKCPSANGRFVITEEKPVGNNVFMVWGVTEDETEELLGLETVELYVMQ